MHVRRYKKPHLLISSILTIGDLKMESYNRSVDEVSNFLGALTHGSSDNEVLLIYLSIRYDLAPSDCLPFSRGRPFSFTK